MKRWLLSAIAFLICAGWLMGWGLSLSRPDDEAVYQGLLNPEEPKKERSSTQHREKVRKDIFLSQNGGRLHARLDCKESTLDVIQGEHEAELTEKMNGISCLMQEELCKETAQAQVLRFFTADEGSYSYGDNSFQAVRASLSRYTVPGVVLPETVENCKPSMKGYARSLSMVFGKEVHFTAEKFQLAMFDDGDCG